MKKITHLIILCTFALSALNASVLMSPDGHFKLKFDLNKSGAPTYALFYKNQPIIQPSKMGFKLNNNDDLLSNFTIENTSTRQVDETWEPVWGEVKQIRNNYNEWAVTLRQQPENRTMTIRFRLFNDGLGFRYEFAKQERLNYFQIADECTEFALTADHKAFWIPGDFDTNEYYYTTTRISEVDASKVDGTGIGTHGYFAKNAVQTPLMLKTDQGIFINIFEAALTDYSAMHLLIDKNNLVLTSALTPDAYGTKAYMQTPHHTPWRTIIASDKATDILASKTILNLNEPSKITDTEFIKPQKYIGIWWGMHVPNTMTWNYANEPNIKLKNTDWNALTPLSQHGAKNENVRRYIDFAADHGFSSVLVEGWNVGWEDWPETGKRRYSIL